MSVHPTVAWARDALPTMLTDIERLVRCESPSADAEAVERSAGVVSAIGARLLGVQPERIVIDGCVHLRWRLGARDPGAARVLLLAHHDTVWPIGSLQTHPFGIADGVMRGPGCFDMLTGLVMALHAAAHVAAGFAARPDAAITLLVTGDEELGSPSSRALIEQEAAGCRAALVLEASGDGGAIKTGRKGVSLYRIGITGRAAHAGLEPLRGRNATVELAHQVLAVAALADAEAETTVTPTVARSGRTTNTVPDGAEFSVDVRALTAAEQRRVDAAIRALPPAAGCTIEVQGGINRPPLEPASSQRLWSEATAAAQRLGLPALHDVTVGGASDGNFTAGMGVPTLDGLGAVGGGAHADDEHVIVGEIPGRTALLAELIQRALAAPDA
ncbi:M20/M25/M40 family metallo-hydrolase [Microbacterium sp. ARD32]|uniref:M20/M25/M40 family metallo-hydrolase n=1 Tax=Microbacterium sp. ARD32 TaxID=2962577 RepID=UPI002882B54F|nr:M20/M25/M40 family metallo-hydrolase [Microbacterium sp. ARD32]MDT0157968.1 M20/M25/M40 family metallo-hydrolase [Microbacterium sp. ARD32]